MSERVAIAGGELGRATAGKLAAAGFTVAGVDRNQEALKKLPDGIRPEAADPTDPAAADSAVDRIAADAGRRRCRSTPSAPTVWVRRSRRHPKTCGS